MRRLFVLTALLFALPAHAVSIDWVEVGDPGNACEVQPPRGGHPGGCFGAAPYTYLISKYEVTNAQYAEFLNAVADTDTYGLYHTNMALTYGGITRSGSPGSYTYSLIAGRENRPVNYVSFYVALRFANWLHNGQPTGAQDSTTTEDGAYTMIAESYPDGPFITRNHDATIFLPSEDEWYKAAYFNGTGYFDYPAGSDTPTGCVVPSGDTGNSANCDDVVGPYGQLTDVGAYSLSGSPYGTFDQGGNLWEWNETIIGWQRGMRGGSFLSEADPLAASYRYSHRATSSFGAASTWEGFRVAKNPIPSCDDGRDNDGDGAIDWNGGPFGEPADPGCWDANDTSENDSSLPCDDGDDNDVDGLTDYPADPGCADTLDASEKDDTGTYPCDDGTDNDGDGQADHPGDPGCASSWDESETDDTGAFPCDDGLDNEDPGDTLVDFRTDGSGDPGCRNPRWPTESPECSDGVDNADNDDPPLADWDGVDLNGDGDFVDPGEFPPDPQCIAAWDRFEGTRTCGLGAELALLLPLLMWLSWRRRRLHR